MASFSSFAFADLAQRHMVNCESEEVKSLMGDNGSCRLLIKSKPLLHKGSCTGLLQQTLPCTVFLLSDGTQTEMGLRCGFDPEKPMIADDSLAEAIQYKVLAVVESNDGKQILQQDTATYKAFLGNNVEVYMSEKGAEVNLNTEIGILKLSQVSCN